MAKKFESVEERRAYNRRHYRVVRARGKAAEYDCDCGQPAKEWAQLHETDGESPEDYQAMCRPCHQKYDDRWNEEERAKVSKSMKVVWDNSPERKLDMSVYPHRLRARR